MKKYNIGLDVGSTTVKVVALDINEKPIYSEYRRHFSDFRSTIVNLMKEVYEKLGDCSVTVSVTGSGGLSVSKWLSVDFVQEVIACTKTVENIIPQTDVAIE